MKATSSLCRAPWAILCSSVTWRLDTIISASSSGTGKQLSDCPRGESAFLPSLCLIHIKIFGYCSLIHTHLHSALNPALSLPKTVIVDIIVCGWGICHLLAISGLWAHFPICKTDHATQHKQCHVGHLSEGPVHFLFVYWETDVQTSA